MALFRHGTRRQAGAALVRLIISDRRFHLAPELSSPPQPGLSEESRV